MKKIFSLLVFLVVSTAVFAQHTDTYLRNYTDSLVRRIELKSKNVANAMQNGWDSKFSILGSYADPAAITSLAGSKITGSITTATLPFSNLTSKPTTISGYGITDAFRNGVSNTLLANTTITGTNNFIFSGTGTKTIGSGSNSIVVYNGGILVDGNTLSLSASFGTSGGNPIQLITSGSTVLNLPTSGTLSTQAGTETITNKTIAFGSNTLTGVAPLESPTFTGTPSGPTAAPGTNTTQLATAEFVTDAIETLVPAGSFIDGNGTSWQSGEATFSWGGELTTTVNITGNQNQIAINGLSLFNIEGVDLGTNQSVIGYSSQMLIYGGNIAEANGHLTLEARSLTGVSSLDIYGTASTYTSSATNGGGGIRYASDYSAGYIGTTNSLNLATWGDILKAKTFGAKQTFFLSTTGAASINIPNGVNPTSPSNNDLWGQGNHLWARLNGVTYQLDQATVVGTITTGTWNASVITGQYGGTGVANTGKTLTMSGNTVIGSSTHTVTFVTTGNTSVTLPTSGTLGVGTVTSIGITPPAAGITVLSSPVTTSGNISLVLANDLAALEGLGSSVGMAARTAADTWTTRTITGTTDQIDISNGTGVSGNPTLSMSATYAGQSSIVTTGTITTGTWNATDVGLGAGGTGATLSDPNAHRMFMWDDTDNATVLAVIGTNLSYDASTNTLSATGGGGGITNGGANNEFVKSDGTNVVGSGFFSSASTSYTFGSASIAGNKTLFAVNSTSNATLTVDAQNGIYIQGHTGPIQIQSSSGFNANVTGGVILTSTSSAFTANSVSSNAFVTETSTTNSTYPVLDLLYQTTGTPATGIGAILRFAAETSASNIETGAAIEAVTTDVTATSEDFDLVFSTMAGGSGYQERARFSSTGATITYLGKATNLTNLEQINETNTTRTLTESDRGALIYLKNAGSTTVTLPNGLSTGFMVTFWMYESSGTATFTASTTLHTPGGATQLLNDRESATCWHEGSNIWNCKGDLH